MKSQNKKERTVAYPHRIFKKISIYLQKKKHIDTKKFTGYQGITEIEELTMTVQCQEPISPQDGRVFDYVISRMQVLGLDKLTAIIDTKDILDELGIANRTVNKKKAIESLKRLIDVSVVLSWEDGDISLKMLESVIPIDGNTTIEVTIYQSFIDAMHKDKAKLRYVNIERVMTARSKYTIELAKVLQMYGRGVNGKGTPLPVKEMVHKELCKYLALDDIDAKATMTQLRKAFNELKKLKYPKYSYNTNRKIWKRDNTQVGSKTTQLGS